MRLIALSVLMVFSFTALADIPSVNQYRIEKRAVAAEPDPTQYPISTKESTHVKKPPFSYFTELNVLKPRALYIIPPYEYVNQLPSVGDWMLAIYKKNKKIAYVPAHWLDDKSATGQFIIEPINGFP